ncbi:glycosyltransferase [Pleurocapsa sp. PCC 7319]|uniref:glycosyltransferase n=1 Tax=Pleurocapsa sp. PCC 7319 TaxID=118161 RepID=UPI00034C4719|nr:glycosyltransferase [Pleurocapsa sp. PCC 7319]
MKIAIISSSFFPVIDGVTVAIHYRLQRLSELGHQVILFCPDYSVLKNIYPNWQEYTGTILPGITVVNLPSTESIGLDFERDVTSKSYQIVEQKLNEFQPEIIHVDEAERLTTRFLHLPGVKFAKKSEIPCVAFYHTNYLDYFDDYFNLPFGFNILLKTILGWVFSWIYNQYDLTLVASRITQANLRQLGIKNLYLADILGVDLTQYTAAFKNNNYLVERYDLPDLQSKIKLLFLGRLTPDKGWNFGLAALSKLPTEIRQKIAIIIAGDGDMSDRIQQTLAKVTSHVYLLGRIPPEFVPALLINGDILITNSQKETKGLTVMEAAAASLPAIAPRAGGVIDTIQDGTTGFLYEPQNESDFLAKLNLLISNQSLRESMGIQAQQAIQKYSWAQVVDNLVEIWTEQINQKKISSPRINRIRLTSK